MLIYVWLIGNAYILLNCLAMLILILFALHAARLSALTWYKTFFYITGLVLFFVFGARICETIIIFGFNMHNWEKLWMLKPIGFSLYGGLIFISLYQFAASIISRQSPWKCLDYLAPGIWSYVALAKMGCFYKGCCFGTPTLMPWGIPYKPGSQAYTYYIEQALTHIKEHTWHFYSLCIHPAQLYESFAALLLLGLSLYLLSKKTIPGFAFLISTSLYSLVRFILFFWRAKPDLAHYYDYLPALYLFVAFICLLQLCIRISHSKSVFSRDQNIRE